jgi:hypothetical protein
MRNVKISGNIRNYQQESTLSEVNMDGMSPNPRGAEIFLLATVSRPVLGPLSLLF